MKTKQIINVFLILFFLSGFMNVNAQSDFDFLIEQERKDLKYAKTHFSTDAKEIKSIFKKMLETANVKSWKGTQYCKPEELLKKIKPNSLKENRINEILLGIYRYSKKITPADTKESFQKNPGVSLIDQGLKAYSETSSFIEFVTAYTGKNLGDIKGEKNNILNEKVKDIDALREYYKRLKSFVNGFERNLEWGYYKTEDCEVKVRYTIKIIKIDYPKVTWEYKIKFNVACNCPIRDAPEKVKSGVVEYTATSEGTYTASKRTYGKIKKTTIDIVKLVCCKGDIPEDASYTEPISQPDQTIGYNVGFGFENDFEDISYCAGVEYLKRISDKKSDVYFGGGVSYLGTSYNETTTNQFMVGPKIQIHTPITPSEEVQWVNGFKGYYSFGNQKNNGYTDKTTGIELSLYSGFNIQLNEKAAVGIEFPALTWDKIKIKPEMGADYEFDNTSLLLNKGNPIKLNLRYNF
jgi:hypothetical protein